MLFNLENVSLEIDEKKILQNISTGFEVNKFNAIIGPNGCGKSSLIKIFAKIEKQTSGKISFLNRDLRSVNRSVFAKKVAFFFQLHGNAADVTVEQMVAYGRTAHKKMFQSISNKDKEIIDEAIEKCDLNEFRNRSLLSLSGGECQRVYLAMTLAQQPEVIVLDEPTNHLDIKYQFQLLTLVRDFMDEKNLTVICILHDFNQVFKYADNTIIISKGEIYDAGKTADVLTKKAVSEVFGVDSVIHSDGNGHHIDFII